MMLKRSLWRLADSLKSTAINIKLDVDQGFQGRHEARAHIGQQQNHQRSSASLCQSSHLSNPTPEGEPTRRGRRDDEEESRVSKEYEVYE